MSEVLEELPDDRLVEQARTGDEVAFAQLYRRHHGEVLRYARGIVRSRADAEDLCADALLRMMLALRSGGGPRTNVPAYLRTTVRRLSADLAGRNSRSFAVGLSCFESEGDPAPWAGHKVQDALLDVAFRGLPQRWRDALWMVEVLGYRPQEIATEFGIARPAACSLLWRARTALRKRYDELLACVPPEG